MQDVAKKGRSIDVVRYLRAVDQREALGRHFNRFHQNWDLLLTPTTAHPASVIGASEADLVVRPIRSPFTYPFNLTQQPAASIPAGLTSVEYRWACRSSARNPTTSLSCRPHVRSNRQNHFRARRIRHDRANANPRAHASGIGGGSRARCDHTVDRGRTHSGRDRAPWRGRRLDQRRRPDRRARAGASARGITEHERKALPLWGVPFSVKDCIDTIGLPTTSACPAFSYTPAKNDPAVERLLAAGAILIGKTNMDQFATGLVEVRSPYGVALNPFDPRYIPGGSSSGAAVSVPRSRQLCARHRYRRLRTRAGRLQQCRRSEANPRPVSGVGVAAACRSIETLSIFALTVPDAQAAFDIARAYHEEIRSHGRDR